MKKLILLAVMAVAGCGGESVSFQALEDARNTANDNAMFNAQAFRQGNVLYKDWSIIPRGDSTQDNKCPQGDGWATLEFVTPDQKGRLKVKCSTVSAAVGCLEDSEFKAKPYAADDGHCQPVDKVPINRKIAK